MYGQEYAVKNANSRIYACAEAEIRALLNVLMSEGASHGNRVQFGPKGLEMVPVTLINELEQIRQHYDADPMTELTTSMVVEDDIQGDATSASFDLGNPLLLGRHDRSHVKRYIADHGEFHEIATPDRRDPSDLIVDPNGLFNISIAGHRRKRAIIKLAEEFDFSLAETDIASSIRINPTFDEALSLQARENTYQKPPAHDEARIIGRLYRHARERHHGMPPSYRQVALQLGYSETKVRDALAFDALPPRIQAFTVDGLLSYSTVRSLKPLYDAYMLYYTNRNADAQTAMKNAEDDLVVFCNKFIVGNLAGTTEGRREKIIKSTYQSIMDQAGYHQEEFSFDLIEDATPEVKRNASVRKLTELTLQVFNHQLRQGDVTAEQLKAFRDALDHAESTEALRRATQLDMPEN